MNRPAIFRTLRARIFSCWYAKLFSAVGRTRRENCVTISKITFFLIVLSLSISTSVLAHHFDGGGHSTGGGNSHYFDESGDAHHFSWNGGTSPASGFTVIKYDFRSQNGFQNFITPDQKISLIHVFGQWSAATGNNLLFVRDTQAPASEIINIGTGDLAALGLGYVSGFGGVAGLADANFDHAADHKITEGVAWMDFSETWDTTRGNGDVFGTFDYFTIAAHQIGHVLGAGPR